MGQLYPDGKMEADLLPKFGAGQYGTEMSALASAAPTSSIRAFGAVTSKPLSCKLRRAGSRSAAKWFSALPITSCSLSAKKCRMVRSSERAVPMV